MDWAKVTNSLKIRIFARPGRALAIMLLTGATVAAGAGVVHAARAAAAKTTMDGVYNDAQAQRGKTGYSQNCAACHLEDLSGSGQALPLAGDAFMGTWEGQSVADLMGLVHDTMPQDKPGSLTPEQSLDIVTYLLKYNQFPAGKEELKNDPDALKNIIITKKGSPPSQ